ncbi:MAG: inositol monophosphatase family protein [Planctomycetota bacterium]
MSRDPVDLLDATISIAESAGAELTRRFRGGELGVERKGGRDLVTDADRAAEARILEFLHEEYPEDAILAEESGWSGAPDRGRLWIVDPLDGTTNFAHGLPIFSVSIALWIDGEPALGVVHAPVPGETFHAVRGHGAFCDRTPIQVSDTIAIADALLATGFSYRRRELDHGALRPFESLLRGAREIRRCGSACLDLAHTAAGVFDGFWEYYLQPHDLAAGAVLILEAGGRVTAVDGSDDFLHGGSLVAGGASIHTALLSELRSGPPHPGRATTST